MASLKSQQLQIRVSPEQKRALKRRAREAGLDLSAYVLAHVLPAATERFAELLRALEDDRERRFVLAELNDLLTALGPTELGGVVAAPDIRGLSPYLQNYVAAMVEQAAHQKRVSPPAWVRAVEPLEQPHFATASPRLRPHLLRSAPVPFKRRNIFVDASLGDRV
jgi:uncharacterized protein (DUF1778 family)